MNICGSRFLVSITQKERTAETIQPILSTGISTLLFGDDSSIAAPITGAINAATLEVMPNIPSAVFLVSTGKVSGVIQYNIAKLAPKKKKNPSDEKNTYNIYYKSRIFSE